MHIPSMEAEGVRH